MAFGSPSMEWNTARPGSSVITVYSVGWSEVPDHYQELDMGYVFDIESLGEDADRTPEMRRRFGHENLATAASSAIAPPGDEPSTEERPRVLHRWAFIVNAAPHLRVVRQRERWLSLSRAQYVLYLHRRLVLLRRGLRLAEILLLGEASWSRLGPGPLPKRLPPPLPKRSPPRR